MVSVGVAMRSLVRSAEKIDHGKDRKDRRTTGGRTWGRWLLGGGNDEIATRQRREVRDEGMLPHQVVQINVRWRRNCRSASRDIHHLRGPNILKLPGILHE